MSSYKVWAKRPSSSTQMPLPTGPPLVTWLPSTVDTGAPECPSRSIQKTLWNALPKRESVNVTLIRLFITDWKPQITSLTPQSTLHRLRQTIAVTLSARIRSLEILFLETKGKNTVSVMSRFPFKTPRFLNALAMVKTANVTLVELWYTDQVCSQKQDLRQSISPSLIGPRTHQFWMGKVLNALEKDSQPVICKDHASVSYLKNPSTITARPHLQTNTLRLAVTKKEWVIQTFRTSFRPKE